MNKYEVMFIIRPDLDLEVTKKIISDITNIFTSVGGKILSIKEIGRKDLAYEIKFHKKGYYVWLEVESDLVGVNNFNRIINITEDVIRYIILKEE